jgi:hypothetical protein
VAGLQRHDSHYKSLHSQQDKHTSLHSPWRRLVQEASSSPTHMDALDGFRRGGWRAACAEIAARTWRPFLLFNLSGDAVTSQQRYMDLEQRGEVVTIISEAAARLAELDSI